eukprot:112257_1
MSSTTTHPKRKWHNNTTATKSKNKKPTKKFKRISKRRQKLLAKKKNQQHMTREEIEAPKSFIIIRGRVTKYCKFLRDDLRLIFSPYTAAKLEEKQSNSLKDFIVSSSQFGVTHLVTLSQSDIAGTMLRMIRLPKGPTFWFQIKEYSLIQDIIKMRYKGFGHRKIYGKRWRGLNSNKMSSFLPKAVQYAFCHAPLVILNGFSTKMSVKNRHNEKFNRVNLFSKQLMSVMFKHMFCPINVVGMKLNQCKRVVFFNYDNENDRIQMRHYKIQIANDLQGISKGVKKILKGRKMLKGKGKGKGGDKYPDLSGYNDINDYVMDNKEEYLSDSEVEDDEHTKVIIDKINNIKNVDGGCFIRLKEIGPRIDMELVKIEELINDGKVLYHRYVSKTEEEVKLLQQRKDEERRIKEMRKVKQQFNVQRKVDTEKEKQNTRIENRKKREVDKLLQSFEMDKDDDGYQGDHGDIENDIGKKRSRGILKDKNNDNTYETNKKKRKIMKKKNIGRAHD